MNLKQYAEDLLFRTWWTYPSGLSPWVDVPYHAFNLFEGAVWAVLSGLVLRRWLRRRRSAWEIAYALAFFTFGLTDFREAYALQSWLLLAKGVTESSMANETAATSGAGCRRGG